MEFEQRVGLQRRRLQPHRQMDWVLLLPGRHLHVAPAAAAGYSVRLGESAPNPHLPFLREFQPLGHFLECLIVDNRAFAVLHDKLG